MSDNVAQAIASVVVVACALYFAGEIQDKFSSRIAAYEAGCAESAPSMKS